MKLADIQTRISDLVKTSALLNERPVLIEDKGNLVSLLETTLQTQSLAVVVAVSGGQVKEGAPRGRAAWTETFEVVIHRGVLDADDVPSTLAVLEDLRAKLHGADVHATDKHHGTFSCSRHDLREGGDGSYARVLTLTMTNPISYEP